MKVVLGIAVSVLLLPFCACEEAGFVEKSKYDQLGQENADLKKQLAAKEDEIKKTPRHHYSLHREGLRTWRFDADTGKTCIQLTTEQDWKKANTMSQSCQCDDLFSDGANPDENTRKLYCGW